VNTEEVHNGMTFNDILKRIHK